MQIKHIDENTIRVRIDKEELSARGLRVLDLLGNKEKIQQFFYSILSEVDQDHTFTRDTPVSFQVMPNSNGLDLLISKVNNFSNNNDLQKILSDDNQDFDDGDQATGFYDLDNTDSNDENVETSDSRAIRTRAYQFKDLGDVVELANSLQVSDLASSLYLYRGSYFLKLFFVDEVFSEISPQDAWLIANEYGMRITPEQMKVVQSQGNCVMQADALANIRRYFDK